MKPIGIVLGFAFGHRGVVNGVLEPGLTNEVMARLIADAEWFGEDHLICVQEEIGTAMRRVRGRRPDLEVTKHHLKEGAYLDTDEVARQMAFFVETVGASYGTLPVHVVCHQDHAPRVVQTLAKYGVVAQSLGKDIPFPYDPKSHQIWTRYRWLFLLREKLVPLVLRILGRK